ncbi:glyoxalase [Chryseobacterium shigense]|uniref:Bleomycin resistance protein n=1 Tax=Chryseobacterium shigense TaxID=297244 RepID=A0A1N7IW21_9FLAO|nr:VOC family protein [Chryseobacterium shigense]PQA92361.1 glyoxalase [Chryseobacterium shigense]SIS41196.1 Catechol 2,3-dioxygenase [Chryseobacterium shigense]
MEFNRLTPELQVSNIAQSKLFYVKQLGFTVEFEREEDRFILISYEGSQLMLEEDHPEAWITEAPVFPRGRGINFQIEVNSLSSIIAKIKEYCITYFREPKEQWYRINNKEEGVKELLIQDPDGYLLRFQEYLGERDYTGLI